MKIRIDLKTCQKSGQCFYTFPDWVTRAGDNAPLATEDAISEENIDNLQALVDCCPAGAIRVDKTK